MQTPSINAVGLLEVPAGYESRARNYRPATRLLALLFLLFFAGVTIASTVLSLGAYCLTSDGGDTRDLRSSPLLLEHLPAAGAEQGAESSAGPDPVP